MERISGVQTVTIGVLYIFSVGIKQSPILMLEVARQDAWLGYFVAVPVMLLSIWLFSKIMSRFKDKTLFEALETNSPFIGRVVIFIYIVFFLFVVAHDVRFLIDLINIIFLPTTPMVIIGVFTFSVAILIAREGIEILARMSQFFLIPFGAAIFLLPIMLNTQIDWRNVQPIFNSMYSIAYSGMFALGTIGEIIILPLIVSYPAFRFRYGLYSVGLGTLLIGIMTIHIILVFGANLAPVFFDPAYILVRQIRMTDFLDRMDIIIAALWLPTIFVKTSLSLFVICKGLQHLSKKISGKLLVTPVGVFGFVCSIWFFEHATQLIDFDRVKPLFISVTAFLIPMLLFFILKKDKQNTNTSSTSA